jgi:hypothetical protein
LIPAMLHDLPGYANRVIQRNAAGRPTSPPPYVILAGRPEYQPLTLGPGAYTPVPNAEAPEDNESTKSNESDVSQVSQVFFTTLERQYVTGTQSLQRYHWLFLTHTDHGWRLVLMLSSLQDAPNDQPPTPPRDTSDGALAQAIRLWLRDCEAGSIAPLRQQLPPNL